VMNRRSVVLLSSALWLCGQHAVLVVGQDSGPKLAILDRAGMERLVSRGNSLATQLDLLLLRENLSLLDDDKRNFMRYFIMLNNCGAPQLDIARVHKAFTSEFDYPSMVTFYKSRAKEILTVVPNTFAIGMKFFPNPTNNQLQVAYMLGDYDMARKEFPFVDYQNKKLTIGFDGVTPSDDRSAGGNCAIQELMDSPSYQVNAPVYMVTFKKVTFNALPVEETAARRYVGSAGVGAAGVGRSVTLLLDLEILPDAPQISSDPRKGGTLYVKFPAELKKVTVLDNRDRPIGILYP